MITIQTHLGKFEISDIFEEGGWVIRGDEVGNWLLFEIPQYGGDERLLQTFTNNNLDLAIATAKKLT
jgi:hypothetical protein